MSSKLPPLTDEAFDGEKYKTELNFPKCNHKKIEYVHGALHCACGVAYSGPNLVELYNLLRNQTTA